MRILPIVFLCGTALMAQRPRNDWKIKPFDEESHLNHSLADAPLTSSDRDQINRILDEGVHDSLSDAERVDERKAIMSFRVGSIALAGDGSQQILVRGTGSFCGASGNCSLWIVIRRAGQLRLALRTEGQRLIVRSDLSRGFREVTIGLHDSAFVEQYTVYHWDGVRYTQVDCYRMEYPAAADRPQRPVVAECR
jgi:hypothetical protein